LAFCVVFHIFSQTGKASSTLLATSALINGFFAFGDIVGVSAFTICFFFDTSDFRLSHFVCRASSNFLALTNSQNCFSCVAFKSSNFTHSSLSHSSTAIDCLCHFFTILFSDFSLSIDFTNGVVSNTFFFSKKSKLFAS